MENKTQRGFLMLADISGFTSFMATTELEHSHDILNELFELIVKNLTPTMNLVELEGDAVYVCAPEGKIPRGEILLEIIESTYVAFKNRVRSIQFGTTCTCNACRRIPLLDLKFITHLGDYILQNRAGVQKPVGSDVNLVHRLTKNHVSEATNWRAYALFTEPAIARLGLNSAGMHVQMEAYEHLGEIKTFNLDLAARYQELTEARPIKVTRDQSDWRYEIELNAPLPLVWNYLVDGEKLARWGHIVTGATPAGNRRGTGMRAHCNHGKSSYLHTILDWRPFDYLTFDTALGNSSADHRITYQLTPTEAGTFLGVYMKLLRPLPGLMRRWQSQRLMDHVMPGEMFDRLRNAIQEEMATQM